MLSTRAGLTLAARPRSTSQTSPRCGVAMSALATVHLYEDSVRRAQELLVGRALVQRGRRSAKELRNHLLPLGGRQLLEGVQDALGSTAHEKEAPPPGDS